MQEHEYKARDKTVQKMSRDGLREENLRNKEEKRITGRDMDTEVSRSEKKDELDFSKRRREHINEKRETEHPEQSSKKTRYSRESVLDEEAGQDIDGELDGEQVADESTAATKSAFRSESIRGQPRGERAYLETVADSRDLRKKKMVRDYASKERRKEKEASEESKTAKREATRYRETSEVAEESLDGFSEEIKGKSKRERVLKEQRKKSSRLSFGDESDGMIHGAGIGIRSSASAVKDATATALYGARGANGVISVTTKEGREGKVTINARVENSFSSPTKKISQTDPVTYMRMQNEAIKTRDPLGLALYSEEKITMTERGLYPNIFPTTDWYDTMFNDVISNQRANLSLSGGGTVARYYVAANVSKDNGNMKVDKRNNFN